MGDRRATNFGPGLSVFFPDLGLLGRGADEDRLDDLLTVFALALVKD